MPVKIPVIQYMKRKKHHQFDQFFAEIGEMMSRGSPHIRTTCFIIVIFLSLSIQTTLAIGFMCRVGK